MKAKNILCPVDFSECSDASLDLASQLAMENSAKLYIVHVEETSAVIRPGLFDRLPPLTWKERYKLSKAVPTKSGIRFEHKLLIGDPAEKIVEYAKTNDIDLIVMGSHGRTGLLRAIVGSVADAVIRRSPVPVLTLRARTREPVTASS